MSKMTTIREAKGLSELGLSRSCRGVTVAMIRDIEAGHIVPLTHMAVTDLASTLDVSELDVIHATGSPMKIMRAEIGISQQELSDKSGVSRSMIGAIESGSRVPSMNMVKMLALGLGVPTHRVLSAVDPEFA